MTVHILYFARDVIVNKYLNFYNIKIECTNYLKNIYLL